MIAAKENLILSLDQGGHSSRAIVYDCEGEIVVQARYRLDVDRPQPYWVEQDGVIVAASMRHVIADVAKKLGDRCAFVIAAGLATQRSNSMCWNIKNGQALSKAISWQDTRSYSTLQDYASFAEEIHQITGLYLTAHYGASKLRWCLDNLPQVRDALELSQLAWGPLASYLIYALTKEQPHLVDPANAARTLLWNLIRLNWDERLLRCFHLSEKPLPRCVPTKYNYGHIPFGSGQVPLSIVTGDQSAAMFAFGMPKQNILYINMGTGAFLQYSTGAKLRQVQDLLSGIIYHDGVIPQYCIECTVNGAGSALSLVEDELGLDKQWAEKNFDSWLCQAKNVPLFLNGVSGLGSPFWISDFQSRFIGSGEDWQKIVAVAESILFLINVNMARLSDAGLMIDIIYVTGGLSVSNQLCQRLADLTGKSIYRPTECEATARGTAWLAADGRYDWRDNDSGDQIHPVNNPGLCQRYDDWLIAMTQALSHNRSDTN
ncbi:MAG: FGGY family carbohydrate kinase [Thiohalomonadales bacterium]